MRVRVRVRARGKEQKSKRAKEQKSKRAKEQKSKKDRERERFEQCCSAPVSILFGHFGGYASAGHRSAQEWWRTAHPSSSDGDDGSRQRAWTKSLKALRHFASRQGC